MPRSDRRNFYKFIGIVCFLLLISSLTYIYIAAEPSMTSENERDVPIAVVEKSIVTDRISKHEVPYPGNNLNIPTQSASHEDINIVDSGLAESPIEESDIAQPAPGNYTPFYSLKPTKEDAKLLYIAREKFTEICMQEKGFDYIPNEYKYEPPPVLPGMGDVATASTDGYGIASSTMDFDSITSDTAGKIVQEFMPPAETKNPNDELLETLTSDQQQAWNNALLGSNDIESSTRVSVKSASGGPMVSWDSASCAAIARGELHGDNIELAENKFALYTLQRQAFAAAEEDIEYRTSIAQWSSCMSENGYDFAHPGEATETLLSKYRNGDLQFEELQKQEIKIATVDAACYSQFAVGEAYDNALKNAESALLVEKSETISNLKLALQMSVNRAQR